MAKQQANAGSGSRYSILSLRNVHQSWLLRYSVAWRTQPAGAGRSGYWVSSEPAQLLNEPHGTGRPGSCFRNMNRPERSTGRVTSGGLRTCRKARPRPRRSGCRRQRAGESGRSPGCRHPTRPDACSTAHRPGPPGAFATGSARRFRVRQQQTRMTRTARAIGPPRRALTPLDEDRSRARLEPAGRGHLKETRTGSRRARPDGRATRSRGTSGQIEPIVFRLRGTVAHGRQRQR